MSGVSARTAEIALTSMSATLRLAKRNGRALSADWVTAYHELAPIAVGAGAPERTDAAPIGAVAGPLVEEVDVIEAAHRLSLTRRAVQRRCAEGRLPARRVGRSWLISWTKENAA